MRKKLSRRSGTRSSSSRPTSACGWPIRRSTSTFQVHPAETEGQLIYQLDHGQWDIPALRTLLEELLPQNTVFNDYEVTQTFERIGPRTMLLNARRLDDVPLILLAMEDITVRTQTERRLQQEMAERQRLERDAQRVAHFALLGRLAAGLSHELRNPLGVIVLHRYWPSCAACARSHEVLQCPLLCAMGASSHGA